MTNLRHAITKNKFTPEGTALSQLIEIADLSTEKRAQITKRATKLVEDIRAAGNPSLMELFLEEYGLSSDEGVALMCLAEALLRIPDAETIDALIEDKIVPNEWASHLGASHSSLVNASTWALLFTGKVLDDDEPNFIGATLRRVVKRMGEPVVRLAVGRAMKEMGHQFVLGQTIEDAIKRAAKLEEKGYSYSYDMLGEAALTERDAERYHMAYADAITDIARSAKADTTAQNPGISIKLSALCPRYETAQKTRVMAELVPRTLALATLAKSARIGLNIDAEEAGRLDLSLDVIDAVLANPVLAGWDGFGVVVQAYSKRAPFVLDWLYDRAQTLDRQIMVRLVKGAYWDTEIKHCQVEGLSGFPVFTRKASTDLSYLACAQKLFSMNDRIYPQFATHNAHTVAAILEMAPQNASFEFQRLHGMGEELHNSVLLETGHMCRIYAPVGAHKDLLAYLVRRLLENGANSSFVNQIVDTDIPASEVAKDPIAEVLTFLDTPESPAIRSPQNLFGAARKNSTGWDIQDEKTLARLANEIAKFNKTAYQPQHLIGDPRTVISPSSGLAIGKAPFCDAFQAANLAQDTKPWDQASAKTRAEILRSAADLYEENATALFALLMSEAGKTLMDCVGELREAVDFLRYYADHAERENPEPRGVFTCISPWNFPLAIFTGQIAAALAAGNGVLAKPAENTTLIADFAVDLLIKAGVPSTSLVLVAGDGGTVGPILTSHSNVKGVTFTGSTQTAQQIHRNMATHLPADTPLIAETGGLNAMVVDSTALLEQAVGDIIASAFQSAGQRCSALRVLYVQNDIRADLEKMLFGAMDCLKIGDPTDFSTDIGPVIDAAALAKIKDHIDQARNEGRLLKQLDSPKTGFFIGPSVISVAGIDDLKEEIFGPVLHIAGFEANELDDIIEAVNASGYGLTFGLHSRIDNRAEHFIDNLHVGNIYINRNQIGAVVGSQPFGGHGLSGTGPKAGGPMYLPRFSANLVTKGPETKINLPSPTGEENQYFTRPKSGILCLGPTAQDQKEQQELAQKLGCENIVISNATNPKLKGISAALYWGDTAGQDAQKLAQHLAAFEGPILQLVSRINAPSRLVDEFVTCVDTTASGGNADLLNGNKKVLQTI